MQHQTSGNEDWDHQRSEFEELTKVRGVNLSGEVLDKLTDNQFESRAKQQSLAADLLDGKISDETYVDGLFNLLTEDMKKARPLLSPQDFRKLFDVDEPQVFGEEEKKAFVRKMRQSRRPAAANSPNPA